MMQCHWHDSFYIVYSVKMCNKRTIELFYDGVQHLFLVKLLLQLIACVVSSMSGVG